MNERTRQKAKVLIFDFDGVICDSFEEIILTLNSIAHNGKIKNLSKLELNKFRCIETREIFSLLGISNEQLPAVVSEALKRLNTKMTSLKLVQRIENVLSALHKRGIALGIVTSNSKENVLSFLEHNQMNYFNFIYAGGLFNKGEILKELIHTMKYNPNDVFYVGDETRDILASREAKIQSVAVSWGFNHKNVLIRHKPDYLLSSPNELANFGA